MNYVVSYLYDCLPDLRKNREINDSLAEIKNVIVFMDVKKTHLGKKKRKCFYLLLGNRLLKFNKLFLAVGFVLPYCLLKHFWE